MTRSPSDEITHRCDASLVRAFSFLGKRWNGLILGALSYGPAGFAELGRRLDGISDSVLSERLVELGGAGLVDRDVAAGPPVAVTYALTGSGEAVVPALRELASWASDNLDGVS
ncbi:MAG: winged helix-turn-helix transcriptional regulator [Acidimicrobiales bacterium]